MSVSMTMNGAVIPVLACFIASGLNQGCSRKINRYDSKRYFKRVYG